MQRQANLPKYVADTDRLLREELHLDTDVLPGLFGPRVRVSIKRNAPVLRVINWDIQDQRRPRRLPECAQRVGSMPYEENFERVAGALKQKIEEAGILTGQNRGVNVSLEEGGNAYHVIFPRKDPASRSFLRRGMR